MRAWSCLWVMPSSPTSAPGKGRSRVAHDILIVDDEADIRAALSGILEDEGYSARTAADASAAESAVRSRRPALVILDIWLEGSDRDGMALLDQLMTEHAGVPVIMISGHGNIETAVSAIKRGAYDFIEKPFQTDRLLLIVRRAIEAAQLRRENEELRLRAGSDDDLIGDSFAINQVRQAIKRVAPTGSRVLITGPAGAGKEVVARQLHRLSNRADGPFVVINAATMAPDRFEMRAVRRRARRQRCRGAAHDRHLRARPQRHALPRQCRRHAAGDPGQDPAGSAGANILPGRRQHAGSGRRPRHRRVQPRPDRGNRRRQRSGKISITGSTSCLCACRRSPTGARTLPLLAATSSSAPSGVHGLPPRAISEDAMAASAARPNGPATSASCATSSTGC